VLSLGLLAGGGVQASAIPSSFRSSDAGNAPADNLFFLFFTNSQEVCKVKGMAIFYATNQGAPSLAHPSGGNLCIVLRTLRARETIPSHFRIPSSGHLEPIFTRKILNVGFATPAVVLPQIDSIWPKSGREFWEVIISRTLTTDL